VTVDSELDDDELLPQAETLPASATAQTTASAKRIGLIISDLSLGARTNRSYLRLSLAATQILLMNRAAASAGAAATESFPVRRPWRADY